MAEWYYQSGNRKLGPCTFEQLVELALTNAILPDTPISSDGEKWKRARDVPALWKPAVRTPQPADDTMAGPPALRRSPAAKPARTKVKY